MGSGERLGKEAFFGSTGSIVFDQFKRAMVCRQSRRAVIPCPAAGVDNECGVIMRGATAMRGEGIFRRIR